MDQTNNDQESAIPRRDFLRTMSTATAAASLGAVPESAAGVPAGQREQKKESAIVRVAFVYPPTARLRREGYYSWPGSTFDAEGRQKQYTTRLRQLERDLGLRLLIQDKPLDDQASVTRFIAETKAAKPAGLLLIPFKKGHWPHVVRIVDETHVPTLVLATLGVLLAGHVRQLHRRSGVYMISAPDDLDAVARGLRMIRTASWMRQSLIVNITGSKTTEQTVPNLGTCVRTVPHERFYAAFREMGAGGAVAQLAQAYRSGARKIVEPSAADVVDAAKTYFVLKGILHEERADAIMMNCLPGLKRPHKHVPPCMGFMSLRDEGVAMGCESDLDATLTMMLLQQLFNRPGFQHNPSVNTEKNHYFCAHCTSASRMLGPGHPAEPYILRSHAEAGWGCVPRVLMRPGQEITVAKYLSGKTPRMILYTGTILGCPPIPPTGGCRTNVEAKLNELDDVCNIQGHHQTLIYGNFGSQLRTFCQLYGIEVVV